MKQIRVGIPQNMTLIIAPDHLDDIFVSKVSFRKNVVVLLKMDLPGHCYGPSKNGPSRSLLWFF